MKFSVGSFLVLSIHACLVLHTGGGIALAGQCSLCPAGKKCPGGVAPSGCDANHYCPAASSDGQPRKDASGNPVSQIPCPTGTSSAAGSTGIDGCKCEAGFKRTVKCSAAGGTCQNVNFGIFVQKLCVLSSSLAGCSAAGGGWNIIVGKCIASGTSCSQTDAVLCSKCPVGTYAAAEAKVCSSCAIDVNCPEGSASVAGSGKTNKAVMLQQIDDLYAEFKSNISRLGDFSCNTANVGMALFDDKVSAAKKNLLDDPWGGTIKVRSGNGCSCVDFALDELSKEKCELLQNMNTDFRAKPNWCGTSYNVNANHSGASAAGTCKDDDTNIVRFYYKKW